MSPVLQEANIIVVDDDPALARLMLRTLRRGGYEQVTCITRSSEVAAACAAAEPDLVLLDVRMPAPDGLTVLDALAPLVLGDSRVPVIMLTAVADAASRRLALSRGATEFLLKPFDADEVLLRIRNVLETRRLQLHVKRENAALERQVQERTADLVRSQVEVIDRLAFAAEFRDDDTHEHAQRVGRSAALIGERLGLPPEEVSVLRRAAPLHDVGKIGVSDSVLLKPGKLTSSEFATMKGHAAMGARILSGSTVPVLQMAEVIARAHHERWDGSGYPAGLAGEDIPLVGRVVAVADVFDALTHARPYKDAWPVPAAIAEVHDKAGTQFDPTVVEAFLALEPATLMQPVRTLLDVAPVGYLAA